MSIELLKSIRSFLANCDAKSDYCMCGDKIEEHSWGSGHSPVDAYQYTADKYIADIDAAIHEAERKQEKQYGNSYINLVRYLRQKVWRISSQD